MLKTFRFAALAAVVAVLSWTASAAPPVEAFGALPAIQGVTISPSGKYFAVVQNEGGKTAVKTYDVASMKRIGGIAAGKDQIFRGVRWHSDDRLLLVVGEVADYKFNDPNGSTRRGVFEACRLMSVARDGSNLVSLLPKSMIAKGLGNLWLSACDIVSLRGSKPNTLLLQAYSSKDSGVASKVQPGEFTVQSVNVLTGEAETFEDGGTRNTYNFIADPTGRIRLRFDAEAGQSVVRARLEGSSEWVEVHRQVLYDFEEGDDTPKSRSSLIEFLGFGAEPNQVYVSYWPGDRSALGVFDLAARKLVAPAAADPKYDVDGAIRLGRGRIVGAWINRTATEQIFFNDDWKQLQSVLASSFPNHRVWIASSSEDLTRHVIYIEGPQWPAGVYQILDLQTSEASMVGSPYPALTAGTVGEVRNITYRARDGMAIDAYLTLPPGRAPTKLAAIVLPHGGPAARDSGNFDWLSQFFASRGYVVLQPQYRGSTGFGSDFARAGEKQWGLKMQDDVSDSVKYLTSNGFADPNRICIMGWSYGGYAAMTGAALTPELYRCSIAGAGVSDLIEMLLWEKKWGGWKNGPARYWRNHIGDMATEKDKLIAASAARHANNVRAPMLLVHGELDPVVPIEQSQLMADALKAAGKPYEFVVLPGENHNMSFASTRIKTLTAMEAFLAKHNPAN